MSEDVQVAWDPFASLSNEQRERLAAFQAQLLRLNRRINLISRESEAAFTMRHLQHALALSVKAFTAGARVVDWGTGGGIPAIPLAIVFPDVTFYAIDAVGKKVQAVQVMARRLALRNVRAWQGRAERWPGPASFSVSRAAAPLATLWHWHRRVYTPPAYAPAADAWAPGLVCLKGGDLTEEVHTLSQRDPTVRVKTTSLSSLYKDPYFAEKKIVEVFIR